MKRLRCGLINRIVENIEAETLDFAARWLPFSRSGQQRWKILEQPRSKCLSVTRRVFDDPSGTSEISSKIEYTLE